jgi:hypothetical protein
LPSADGTQLLQVATDYDGGVCKASYAIGSLVGTGDTTGVATGATYRLVSAQSGHCLDVDADSRVDGGNVQQWTCDNLGEQNWIVTSHGAGYFTLRGQNSGLCLDVAADSRIPGGDVQQWTCLGGGNQDWRIVNVGRGYYQLIARNSGLCLDVAGGSVDPGANVQQWTCNNQHPQIWRFERR